MALVGYARVSTLDQDSALQRDALTAAGCEKLFEDRASGARADRPGLAQALAFVREGDILLVWKLDRLGRSLMHLVETVAALAARGVGLAVTPVPKVPIWKTRDFKTLWRGGARISLL